MNFSRRKLTAPGPPGARADEDLGLVEKMHKAAPLGIWRALGTFARETVGRADQPVEIPRLGVQVAGVGNDVELDLGPGLLELPRGQGRSAAVVAALDDDAGNAAQLLGVAQQLTFLEPALLAK